MTTETEPRGAVATDLDALAATLARAFEHDPVWSWCFEGEERVRKLAGLGAVFGFLAAAALDYGWVRLIGDADAVALWIPPGEPEMSAADEERLPGFAREHCGEGPGGRVKALMEAFERNHPHGQPHYYLSVLGTDPDRAGQGIGMALVAANLAEIDAAAADAFLESTNPANVARYERAGFRPDREVELVAGISATQMWRRS